MGVSMKSMHLQGKLVILIFFEKVGSVPNSDTKDLSLWSTELQDLAGVVMEGLGLGGGGILGLSPIYASGTSAFTVFVISGINVFQGLFLGKVGYYSILDILHGKLGRKLLYFKVPARQIETKPHPFLLGNFNLDKFRAQFVTQCQSTSQILSFGKIC